MDVGIVRTGTANVGSVANILRRVGAHPREIVREDSLSDYQILILPGVGSFDSGMSALRAAGLDQALRTYVQTGGHVLGICLGMQLMMESSEEGRESGLGLFEGTCVNMRKSRPDVPIPHVGWGKVHRRAAASTDEDPLERFYFTHSYAVQCRDPSDIWMTSDYSGDFVAAIQRENVTGVQFHPEKSNRHGMAFLAAYLESRCVHE